MLKVFLVDDEHLVRKGLKKLIPWEQLGFVISGEACDGEQALELINADNTDIVITDLKMPIMDGLMLTSKLKESYPGIKVIVLTGFDDFEYMQQSIRNNVTDYLLKPVNAELLTDSLLKIKDSFANANYSYPFMLESKLLMCLENCDETELRNLVSELFDDCHRNKVPQEIIKNICTNILITVNAKLDSRGSSLDKIISYDCSLVDYFNRFASCREVEMEFGRVLQAVLEYNSQRSDNKLIDQIKVYIEKHLEEDITLSAIAAKFYLNPSYLSQLFKSETGENYVDFLMKCRIDKAKKLLETGENLRIQDICEMVGYNDAKYFGQLFKKHVGVLPSEYKLLHGTGTRT